MSTTAPSTKRARCNSKDGPHYIDGGGPGEAHDMKPAFHRMRRSSAILEPICSPAPSSSSLTGMTERSGDRTARPDCRIDTLTRLPREAGT